MLQKLIVRLSLIVAATLITAMVMVNGTAHAQDGVIEQCANGDPESDPNCTSAGSTGWITGNVNANKATYTLGDFVAYRQLLTDLTVDYTYCFGLGWDTNISGEPAVDYIGTFNNTITAADPTHGYAQHSLGSPDETTAIPADPVLGATMSGDAFTGSQAAGVITTWGTSGFVINGYSNDGSQNLETATEQSLEYCFTATNSVAILAWSGHVAEPAEWGDLARPTGSPYHMSQGTRQGLFNAPRTSETDLACVSNDPEPVITHNNEGRKDTQLQISDPSAIGLAEFGATGQGVGIPISISLISILLLATYLVILQIRKQGNNG